jgi:hypothetical protein
VHVEEIEIDQIVVPRDLVPDDDLSDLIQSLEQTDLEIPILLNQNNHLIDGLRRIEAFRKMGRNTIACVRSTNLNESLVWIEKTREHGLAAKTLIPRRVYQFHQALRDQMLDRATMARQRGRIDNGKGQPPNPLPGEDTYRRGPSRYMLGAALGIGSRSWIEATLGVYIATEKLGPRGTYAKGIAKRVDSGELSAHQGVRMIQAFSRRMDVPRLTPGEQREMMERTLTQVNGLSRVLDSIGAFDSSITNQDLERWERQLREFSRGVSGVALRMRREREGKRNV